LISNKFNQSVLTKNCSTRCGGYQKIQISKYIQHSLPCTIRSQTCPVHIVLLHSWYCTEYLFHLYIIRKSSTWV